VERVTRRAAFLDRDGTINEKPGEHEYVSRVEEFHILPGAVHGLTKLADCGYALVVVSNQRGVARGLVSDDLLRATEKVLQEALRPHGAEIAGFYYCPHELHEKCGCRKPRPGMLLQAASELNLDLAASWMIGDSPSDIEAGRSAGCRTVYLGDEREADSTLGADSLEAAANSICADP
jgi:D-glycero-D-manno-heptose 1,7-bisphosphate phosphatase